jgi:hypothetical protein
MTDMRRLSYPTGITFILLLFFGCSIPEVRLVEPPGELREAAYAEAERYIGMEYEWGGQDFPARGIDCSGLVVNVYRTVTEGTPYSLPFSDTTAAGLYEFYTVPIGFPETVDLVFMGESGSSAVTHVAIVQSITGGSIYFIDSTYRQDFSINGVTYRCYPENDPKIKGFGRVLTEFRG